MLREDVVWACVLLVSVAALAAAGVRCVAPAIDPAAVNGASPVTCFDCKDMDCGFCAPPMRCHHVLGYCYETVRNLSQFCAPRKGGQWENCKWRVDQSGSCVTTLLNPCTPENVVCFTPNSACGPLGTCIPEGVCTH
jgi:hypothetical protein